MPAEVTIGKNRRGCDIFSDSLPTIPSNSIPPCLLHDWRKIKGHCSLNPAIQVCGWFNFFLAIYDVILFKKGDNIK